MVDMTVGNIVFNTNERSSTMLMRIDDKGNVIEGNPVAIQSIVLEIESLKKQLNIAKEALEYYSDEECYEGQQRLQGYRQPGVLTEGGNKAREALKAIEGNK